MNNYSKTLYKNLPLTQGVIINRIIHQGNTHFYADAYHLNEASYLMMKTIIINQALLNKKVGNVLENYLPTRLTINIGKLFQNQATVIFQDKAQRYHVGLILNTLIYYFKKQDTTAVRKHYFSDLALKIDPLFDKIYQFYIKKY